MGRTNKSAYKKHAWSGAQGSSKRRVRAALRYYYENTSQPKIWRNIKLEKARTHPDTFSQESQSDLVNTSSSNVGRPLKTYARVKPAVGVDVTFTPDQENIKQEILDDPLRINSPSPDPAVEILDDPLRINWPNPDPAVENQQLQEEPVPNEVGLSNLSGYRIVDINHVLRWAFSIERHKAFCRRATIEFVNESRNGLNSILTFQCRLCGKLFKQSTEKEERINKAFVRGTLTAGSYYTASAHVTSCMDIPTMTPNTFWSIEKELGDVWQGHLKEEIKKPGEEVETITIEKGNV